MYIFYINSVRHEVKEKNYYVENFRIDYIILNDKIIHID